jgi:hypothetical protein
VTVVLEPIVGLYDQFEQFLRRLKQLEPPVLKLLKVLFLQLVQTRLKDILFTVIMRQPHQQEQVIGGDVLNHVFFQEIEQAFNLQEFNNRIVIQNLSSFYLNSYPIKTFQYILKV